MKITPLYDNILIEAIKENEISKGGVYIPETTEKEKPQRGIVVAVGPGKNKDGSWYTPVVKVGDEILFNKYGPNEIKIDDKEYLVATENDILALITNE